MSKRGPTIVDTHVGKRLTMQRRILKMSQTALGQALGVSFQQIQKYEKGINRVAGQRLQLLATTLNVPVGFFFEGAPGAGTLSDTVSSDFIVDFMADRCGVDLARCFVKMLPKHRAALLALAEALTVDVSTN